MLRCLLSGMLILLAGAVARANDSLAEVRTGGLVLQRSADIRMVREVQVTTTFVNEAAKAVTSIVAFPVPEIPAEPEGDIHIDLTQANPLTFTITVNGQAQAVKVEKKTDGDMVQLRYYWE